MKLLKMAFTLIIGACFYYGCDDILAEDISEDEVSIIAPVDGSILSDPEVNFSWNYLDDATAYHLQVVYPDFVQAQKLVLDTVVTKNNFTETMVFGEYEWRLKGVNDQYETFWVYKKFTLEDGNE